MLAAAQHIARGGGSAAAGSVPAAGHRAGGYGCFDLQAIWAACDQAAVKGVGGREQLGVEALPGAVFAQ